MKAKIKVHIVGTHGVPARYGGFETLADFLCQHLSTEFDITVYCNANKYPERQAQYFGAKLKYVPLEANGFKGIFYDLLTFCQALFSSDVILYLSPVGSGFITPLKLLTNKRVIVNHGGLNEWEREKLNRIQKWWAKFNHFIAANFADINIADNHLYQASLKKTFGVNSVVIRYGGDHAKQIPADDSRFKKKYPFVSKPYAVSVSRAQVDNNIHLVLKAFELFTDYKIVLVSNWEVSKYGKDLKIKYKDNPNMILLDAIYDKDELDYVRGNGSIYIHSHSRCGTAPSLVEAMCLGNAVLSYDAPTNRETTHNKAFFFTDSESLRRSLITISNEDIERNRVEMRKLALENYTWLEISNQYKNLLNGEQPIE